MLEQRATGRGRVVEVSLLRTGTYVLGWDLGLQMTLGKVARAEPARPEPGPADEPLPGRRRPLVLLHRSGGGPPHRRPCCRALGRPDLLDDPRFADAGAIRRNRTEVIAMLDEIVAEQPLAVWAERFDREGVWWAPAQTPAEVVDDPQLLANDGIVEIDGGATGACSGRSTDRSASPTSPAAGTRRSPRSASTPRRCWPNWPTARARPGAGAAP